MKRALLLLCLLLPVASWAETVQLAGSTTCLKIVRAAVEEYAHLHAGTTFALSGGGSSAGIARVLEGRTHLGMSSCEPTREERQRLLAAHVRILPIARDAVVPVVSRAVFEGGVRHIRRAELADIYAGRLRNWRALGGPDRAILVVGKNAYHGTQRVFMRYLGLDRVPERWLIELDDDRDLLRLLRASDQAIGYVGIGYLDDSVRALALQLEEGVVAPTPDNIRAGRYPLARTLYLLVAPGAPHEARAFADFLRAPAGQAIVRKTGFVPLAQ
ncbi:MAG: hypothetical protein D6678_02840 [Zetaproteobacteria bacterium]|nr:MAG: hypothetical protein D6678_02840 [Zetaproteobacteria bacterium]